MTKTNRVIMLMVLVMLVAVSLRIFAAVKWAGTPLEGDAVSYDNIANNLIEGHGYSRGYDTHIKPTATRGPTYVLLLASIYAIFGHNYTYVNVFQIIIDCLSCLLLFRICKRLFRRNDAATLASFIYAIYPPFIIYTQRILTETLIIFLSTLAVSLFIDFELFKKKSALYICAIVIGLATLSKPILLLTPLIFYLSTIKTEKRSYRAREMLVQFVLIGLVMSPWVVRNFVVFHSFIPGVTQGGITFWGGTGPANGHVVPGVESTLVPIPEDLKERVRSATAGMSETEKDRWFYKEGLRVIKDNPARYLRVIIRKVPRLWFNLAKDEPPHLVARTFGRVGVETGEVGRFAILFALGNLIAFILAVIGIIRERPPQFSVNLLIWLIVYYTLVHMVFFSAFRYSLPVYAYLFCFSAAGIASIFAGKRKEPASADSFRNNLLNNSHH